MGFLTDSILLGLQYAMLALGVYITFRVLNIPDLTVDGSFTFGIAVSGALTAAGHPVLGLLLAIAAGAGAGLITGFLQTFAGIHPIVAGILTMTGLYTVNITVLGGPNISLIDSDKFFTAAQGLLPYEYRTVVRMSFALLIVAVAVLLLALFFKTSYGLSIRATGDNEDMVRASSINTTATKLTALAIANGLVALSGGVIAQFQGFADINAGSGMIVVGLASVIIGEVLFGGRRPLTVGLISAVVGSVAYRLIIALALQINILNANSLKLISAVIVGITLAVPAIQKKFPNLKLRRGGQKNA